MAYNPNQKRDKNGMWTDDGIPNAIQKKIDQNLVLEEEEKLIEQFASDTTDIEPTPVSDYEDSVAIEVRKYGYDVPPQLDGSLRFYTDNGYRPLNQYLRTGKKTEMFPIEKLTEVSDNVSKFLEGAPKYEGVSYRGLLGSTKQGTDAIVGLKPGDILVDKAFVSSSADPAMAWSRFGRYGESTPSILLKINGKTGVNISEVSAGGEGEREILFNKNTKFKVQRSKDVSRGKRKIHFIELQEL